MNLLLFLVKVLAEQKKPQLALQFIDCCLALRWNPRLHKAKRLILKQLGRMDAAAQCCREAYERLSPRPPAAVAELCFGKIASSVETQFLWGGNTNFYCVTHRFPDPGGVPLPSVIEMAQPKERSSRMRFFHEVIARSLPALPVVEMIAAESARDFDVLYFKHISSSAADLRNRRQIVRQVDERAEALGRLIAEINSIAMQGEWQGANSTHRSRIQRTLRQLRTSSNLSAACAHFAQGAAELRALTQQITGIVARLQRVRRVFSHGDLVASNLLAPAGGGIVASDWDSWGCDPMGADIASLFRADWRGVLRFVLPSYCATIRPGASWSEAKFGYLGCVLLMNLCSPARPEEEDDFRSLVVATLAAAQSAFSDQ